MTTYIPKSEVKQGRDCSGSSGATNRTLTLSNSNISVNSGMTVIVANTPLVYNSDFTFSTSTNKITFLNPLLDESVVYVQYFVTVSVTSPTSPAYCTEEDVYDYLGWSTQIPDYPTTTTKESVDATGILTANEIVYLDNGKLIEDTLTLTYGGTATTGTLTETTHYTVVEDKSQITLTTQGATSIGTSTLLAEYKYNKYVFSSEVTALISRMSQQIDNETMKTFVSPALITQELNQGAGRFQRLYRGRVLPVYAVETALSTAIAATTTTSIQLSDSTGLEAGDYISINKEAMLIDSVTDSNNIVVSRGKFSTTATTHSSDDAVVNYVVEISNSQVGGTPTWQFLEYKDDWELDSDTGAVQLLHINAEDIDDLGQDVFPPRYVFDRVRLTYKYGMASVPDDVKHLCVLMVARELMTRQVARSTGEGADGFSPDNLTALNDQIDKLLAKRRTLHFGYS